MNSWQSGGKGRNQVPVRTIASIVGEAIRKDKLEVRFVFDRNCDDAANLFLMQARTTTKVKRTRKVREILGGMN